MPRPQQHVSLCTAFYCISHGPLFNQVELFYNNILAETSYHLLTSIYYKYSLNLAVMYADTRRWRLQTALFIRGQRSMTVNIISVRMEHNT